MKNRRLMIRYFLVSSLLVLTTVLFFYIAQFIFLENYFVASVRSNFKSVVKELSALDDGDPRRIEAIRRLSDRFGCKIMIVDGAGRILESSAPEFNRTGEIFLPGGELARLKKVAEEGVKGKYFWDTSDVFRLMVQTGPSRYLLIMESLAPVRRYVVAATRFFIFSGSAVLFLGLIFSFFAARHLVRPIGELTLLADRISRLDFTGNFDSGRKDEIGQLGQSMNSISKELSEALKDLREQMESQKRFLSNVAHELRTPIGLLKGYGELLPAGGEVEEIREVIVSETDHLEKLVKDLLLLFKTENRTLSYELEEIPCSFIPDKLEQRFRPLIEKGQISFEVEGGDWDSPFIADPHRIIQIFDNLMSNALRYSEDGGRISIRAVVRESYVEFRLWNSGPRLEEEDLERIFLPLYRADAYRSREGGGNGLGLAIVQALINGMGGHCRAVNEEEGVAFYVVLSY